MPSKPDSLCTWIFTDGHAGNVRQACALSEAMGVTDSVAVELQPSPMARTLAPRLWPGAARSLGDAFADAMHAPPALAIGCGRQGALATRLLRARGTRVVQILDPRLDPRHWDIIVAPEHDGLRGANVITLLGSLNPIDDAWLAHARERFAAFAELPRPRTAVLLGGASAHVPFDAAAFARMSAVLDASVARDGGSLLVTASRRTDAAIREALRARSGTAPGVCWLDDNDGDNPYPGLLAWADRIVCSPDSVNMISEAGATRAPVFVFDPTCVHGRPRTFLDALLARGRIRPLDDTLAAFDVEPLRETARVAAEVRARLAA